MAIFKTSFLPVAGLVAAFTMTGAAQAQDSIVADSGDSGWVLAGALIAIAAGVPGLMMAHSRSVSPRHALVTLIALAGSVLMFCAVGYSLAFGAGSAAIGDFGNAFLGGLADLRDDATVAESSFVVVQLAAALIAVTILLSSLGERARFGWLAAFAPLWLLMVVVPVSHWLWGGGWLAGMGALDAGGGIVVQLTAAVTALAVSFLLGGSPKSALADTGSRPLLGAGLTLVGLMALGGALTLSGGDRAASAALATIVAAATALLIGLGVERWRRGSISLDGAAVALIAGIAAVSCGNAYVGVGGAMLLGLIGALGAFAASWFVVKFDRGGAARAFVAHGGAALLGALAFPIAVMPQLGGPGFADDTNLVNQLVAQLIAVGAVALWTIIISVIAALMVSMVLPMRDGDTVE